MSVVGTFSSGAIGVALSGSNPTPQNAGQLIVNHMMTVVLQIRNMQLRLV